MKKILKYGFYGLLLLIAVLMYNTLSTRSKQITVENIPEIAVDANAAKRLSASVKIATVSHPGKIDTSAFDQLNRYLDSTYADLDTLLNKTYVNKYSRYYKWHGKNDLLKPILLIAHLDVVPVEGEALKEWTEGPYSGKIQDNFIWGRGTMDDKVSALGILEAVRELIKEGHYPERTVYIAFGHDEEILGANGAGTMAKLFKEKGITFDYVLDEGLAIVENALPGIDGPVGLIGLAEKGYVTLNLTASGPGGHSSMPPKHTNIGILSEAIKNLEDNPLPADISGPTKELFEYAAPEMAFPLKMVMSNLWLFEGVIKGQLSNKGTTNATIRTTTAVTMIESGVAENVLPTEATATVNFRIRPGESVEDVIRLVQDRVGDHIKISKRSGGRPASKVSSSEAFGFQVIQRTIRETFPEVIVVPSLVMAATDSRFYEDVSENVYRFLPLQLAPEDMERIHGIDERIAIDHYHQIIRFYYRLLKNSTI